MLECFLIFVVVWLCASVVVIATSWYMAETIQPFFPNWWRRVIADDDPDEDEAVLGRPADSLPDKQAKNLPKTSR